MNESIQNRLYRLVLAMVAAALVALPARAQERVTGDSLRGERWTGADARRLETRLLLGNTLNRFQFSEEQLLTLRKAAEEAHIVAGKYREKFQKLYPEQQRVFRKLFEQNLRNGGAAGDVTEQSAALNWQGRELGKNFCGEIDRISLRVRRALPAAQAMRLEESLNGLQDKKKKLAAGDSPELAELQTEVREVDAVQFGSVAPLGRLLLLPDLDGMLGRRLEKKTPVPAGQAAPVAVPDKGPSKNPGQAPVPPPNPAPGPASAAVWDDPALFFTLPGQPAGAEVISLREEIALLNLINSLDLSLNQAEPIIRLARAQERQAPPDLRTSNWQTRASRDYRATLEELVSTVEKGETLKPEDERRLQRRREQALLVELRERGYSITARSAAASLVEAVAQVRSSLSDYQKQALLDFKPCLIPPKSANDPGLAGQAFDSTRVKKLLDKVRNVPADDWEDIQPKILDDVFVRLTAMQGEFPAEQAAEYRQRLEEILNRVKAMDEVDYRLGESKLAQELEFLDRRLGLAREEIDIKGEEQVLNEKIRAFILNPRTADLLEKRPAR